MLGDDDITRLRELVNAAPTNTRSASISRRSIPWRRLLSVLGLVTAAGVVIASLVFAGALVLSELSNDGPEVDVSAGAPPNNSPTATVDDSDGSDDVPPEVTATEIGSSIPNDPFGDLRYLPTQSPSNMALQAIVRSPMAEPVAAFVENERGNKLTGAVFIDRNPSIPVNGIGVIDLQTVDIAGNKAQLFSSGPVHSHTLVWEQPELGTLRAHGMGTTARELVEVVEGFASDPVESASLPERWSRMAAYDAGASRPIWRATYLASDGEVLAITSAPFGNINTALCEDSGLAAGCANVDVDLDKNGAEIVVFGSANRLSAVRRGLRATTASNARVRKSEIEPGAILPPSSAPRLLYLPDASSEWGVIDTLIHSSGRSVSGPSLMLLERDAPEIGEITSAAVVRLQTEPEGPPGTTLADTEVPIDPPTEAEAGDEEEFADELDAESANEPTDSEDEAAAPDADPAVDTEVSETESAETDQRTLGTIERYSITKAGVSLEVVAWNYFQLELALIEQLITLDDSGLRFATRAAPSIGLERDYDQIYIDEIPVVVAEGAVFGALLEGPDDAAATIRVSSVPRYVPAAAAVLPHENERITMRVRGTTASLIVLDGVVTLTWEEQPGIVIALSGTDEIDVVRLAESLELVRSEDLSVP